MNFATYLETVRFRCATLSLEDSLTHAKLGMQTEAGELADPLKRQLAYGKKMDSVNIAEECGDILWYFVLWYSLSGYLIQDLQDEFDRHMQNPGEIYEMVADSSFRNQELIVRSLYAVLVPIVANEVVEPDADTVQEAIKAVVRLITALLLIHGFTVPQCLVMNDAKLEKRTSKKFNAEAILNRDVEAERKVLEQHADQSGQAAS